jgi:drug/metabolite transporter (DMT)-like permease
MIMASVTALNGFGFTLCSFKSLGIINLSLYSLFSMLGGMVLPFLQGILFYAEPVTVANLACLVLITLALLVTVVRGKKKSGGTVYYLGVFILNGMSGVLAKIYNTAPFDKGDAELAAVSYSVMACIVTALLSGALIMYFRSKQGDVSRMSGKAILVSGAAGAVNKVANYILLIALVHVPSSVQYPMVTGGVMIVSTIASFITKNKPSKREIISVLIAFIALIILVIPTLNIKLFNI